MYELVDLLEVRKPALRSDFKRPPNPTSALFGNIVCVNKELWIDVADQSLSGLQQVR